MGIKRKDRDLEWLSAYRDMENPGRIKAKKSSNMVFIGGVSVIGIVAIIYVQLMNQNLNLTRQIEEHEAYMSDERNKDLFEWHNLLQERCSSLINYREGAEKFLEQLKNADRVSEEVYRYYEDLLKESTSPEAYITGFSAEFNTIHIRGIVPENDMPRMFAERLTNEKDEEGNPRFLSVEYTGFNRSGNGNYQFSINIILWKKPK